MPNQLKLKLQAGRRALGCLTALPSADVAEILARAGFDFLFIDQEHGPGGLTDAIAQMRAMKGTDAASLVRLPSPDPTLISRMLDAGADGIICPQVETAAQAAAIVAACHYPPRGTRGAGGGIRAAAYGFDTDYAARVERDLLIAVQIETPAGVERIDEIAAVAGVDILFIGPRDLSIAMGKSHQFQDPAVLGMVRQAEERILASGKFLGSVIYQGLDTEAMLSKGYHLVITGTDVNFLVQGARAALASRK